MIVLFRDADQPLAQIFVSFSLSLLSKFSRSAGEIGMICHGGFSDARLRLERRTGAVVSLARSDQLGPFPAEAGLHVIDR
jgi:hypothetical protein